MTSPADQLREQVEAITDQFTQPGTKYLKDLNNQLIEAIDQYTANAVRAALESQTNHLFAVMRHLGYEIDQKAVVKLSREWNQTAADNALNREATK